MSFYGNQQNLLPNVSFPYDLVDLTHTLHEHIPTWEGGCGFRQALVMNNQETSSASSVYKSKTIHKGTPPCQESPSFCVMKLHLLAGAGTHMDAPSHCCPGGLSIHDLSLKQCFGPCIVIDIEQKSHEHYGLKVEDIKDFEHCYGPIPEDSFVMVKTGWSQFWKDPSRYHNNHVFPHVSPEAAAYLLTCKVKALGIDTLSPDGPAHNFKVHELFLNAGKILIENVTHLEKMPPTGSFIMALPLKLQGGTESPLRLVGLVPLTLL